MNPKLHRRSSRIAFSGFLALLLPLLAAALACSIVPSGDQSLRSTDIALGIQQTLVAQTSTALVISGTQTAGAPAPVTSTPVSQPLPATDTATAPPLPDTPTPEPTIAPTTAPTGPVEIMEWVPVNMKKMTGCYDKDGAQCWTGSAQVLTITTDKGILIDPAWETPSLVFHHKYDFHSVASIFVDAGKGWEVLRTFPDGSSPSWAELALDLSKYKGKEIRFQFTISGSAAKNWWKDPPNNSWSIEGIYVVPIYAP